MSPGAGLEGQDMYTHIMIPTDGSDLSRMAIRQGVAFAKSIGARVTGITVSPPFHTFAFEPIMVTETPEQYEKGCATRAGSYLATVRDVAAAAGVPCDVIHVIHEHPYKAIISTANELGCDLIFMASHGRKGMSALVLGSETTKVLTHTKIPTLVCR
jgi:nucleotide-binding universal stress UspA family protein